MATRAGTVCPTWCGRERPPRTRHCPCPCGMDGGVRHCRVRFARGRRHACPVRRYGARVVGRRAAARVLGRASYGRAGAPLSQRSDGAPWVLLGRTGVPLDARRVAVRGASALGLGLRCGLLAPRGRRSAPRRLLRRVRLHESHAAPRLGRGLVRPVIACRVCTALGAAVEGCPVCWRRRVEALAERRDPSHTTAEVRTPST